MIIGNKNTFAFEIAESSNNETRKINIIIGNTSLCVDDNSVYIPLFINNLNDSLKKIKETDFLTYTSYFNGKNCEETHKFIQSTRNEDSSNFDIENDGLYLTYHFMDWGPTTDNISCFLYQNNAQLLLSYEFWREEHLNKKGIGVDNCIAIDKQELISTISSVVVLLEK